MKLIERVRDTAGLKIIIGSAFLWSWLDALFMSVFFLPFEQHVLVPEYATIAVFGFCLPVLLYVLVTRKPVERLLANKRVLLGFALAGSAGSLLFIYAGMSGNLWALLCGGMLGGGFMAVFELAWGAAYARDGIQSAAPCVAGGFACAILIDTPLLLMIPEASVFFFSLLPFISGIILITVTPEQRTYALSEKETPQPGKKATLRSRFKRYMGVSLMLLGAVILIMIGFGYVQHLISFSYLAGTTQTNGILIQLARGISAILMFIVILISQQHTSIVFRVGLLAMIAGFMMMPLLFGSDLFWISGTVIISGYTALDLLLWVVFSHIAREQSKRPLKTITLLRSLAVLCYIAGAVVGIALVGDGTGSDRFVAAETTVVGYLVVIASVLLLSTEDIWMLFGRQLPHAGARQGEGENQRLSACLEPYCLTSREQEIAFLLAQGRTQPWIAECLSISENTVSTHVRHIYQKADVHNRQEFIDITLAALLKEQQGHAADPSACSKADITRIA